MKRIFNGSGGRKAALILSLCLIFALAVGTTLAYLKANTSPVTNTFKAATSEIKIEEKTDGGIKSEIYVEKDGIYYYTKPVAPTGQTSNLLDGNPIKQPEGAPDGYHLEVTVLAESIQAAPSKAVTDSWGVRVDNNGYLTQPTTTP